MWRIKLLYQCRLAEWEELLLGDIQNCWFTEKRSFRWSQTVLLGLINLPVKTCPSLCVDCHCGAKPSPSIIKPGIRCIFHTRYDLYIWSFCIFRRSSEVCAGLLSLFIYIEMIHLCLLNVEFTAHFTHTSSGVKRKRRKRGGGPWIKTIPS